MRNFVLTSTSVTDGHPDKLCDRISDAIVDAHLARDPESRVNAECAMASGIVFLATRVSSAAHVDLPAIVRRIVDETGYTDPEFNARTVNVLSSASPRQRVTETDENALQRLESANATELGYACRQTQEMLPLAIALAHRLVRRMRQLRLAGELFMLHPDGQAQIAVRHRDRRPVSIEGVTLACARRTGASVHADLTALLRSEVIDPILSEANVELSPDALVTVNPEGWALPGGPTRHAGLTGRKNDIDTYGGYSRHGGAALSGKDPSRVDRTGAYAARYAAKNIVAAGLAEECEVQISYAMGRTEPVSVEIDTFGSGISPDERIEAALCNTIDFDAQAIRKSFALELLPNARGGRFFTDLGAFGHVGRPDLDLPWERIDRVNDLLRTV
jgi:S-adenosylmethionine synthetase